MDPNTVEPNAIQTHIFYTKQHPYSTQLDELWLKAFGESSQEHRNLYCSTPFAYLVATQSEQAVGVVKLYQRPIVYEARELVLGGFGGVTTAVEFRRKRVAHTLLRNGKEILRHRGCDIAYLNTDFDNPGDVALYSQLGFLPLNKPYTFLDRLGARHNNHDGMVAAIMSEDALNQVLSGSTPFNLGVGNW